MWLRHFSHKSKTKKYQAFKARYEVFHPDDICFICVEHHDEISRILYLLIGRRARRLGPCMFWTWKQAEQLIADCTNRTNQWLKTETPGVEGGRLATTSRR